ncbi:MAG: hypothetical protein J6L00_03155 [Clostridia bacterium]|nr:hypothetical protein [Clostridia bacterium]
MKRSLVCVVCVVLIFLTACHLTGRKPPVTEHFSCDFTATYDGMQLSGAVQRGVNGTILLSLSAPASLAGLQCQLDGENITLTLGDLEYKTEVIPAAAVPRLLRAVLDALRYATADTTDADVTVYTGTVGTYAFTANVAADSGVLQTVAVPDAKLEMQFTQVKKIKE